MLTLFPAAVILNLFFQKQHNQKHSKISNSPQMSQVLISTVFSTPLSYSHSLSLV